MFSHVCLQTQQISGFLSFPCITVNAYSKWVCVWGCMCVCYWVCQAGSQQHASGRWCIQPRHWLFILLCLLLAQCYSIIIWFMDWHGVYMYPNEWLFSASADVLHVSVCAHIYLICVCVCEREAKKEACFWMTVCTDYVSELGAVIASCVLVSVSVYVDWWHVLSLLVDRQLHRRSHECEKCMWKELFFNTHWPSQVR